MKFCPYCGEELLDDNSAFCAECGRELKRKQASRQRKPPDAQRPRGKWLQRRAQISEPDFSIPKNE